MLYQLWSIKQSWFVYYSMIRRRLSGRLHQTNKHVTPSSDPDLNVTPLLWLQRRQGRKPQVNTNNKLWQRWDLSTFRSRKTWLWLWLLLLLPPQQSLYEWLTPDMFRCLDVSNHRELNLQSSSSLLRQSLVNQQEWLSLWPQNKNKKQLNKWTKTTQITK